MNRILFEADEPGPDGQVELSDHRAAHILNVLRPEPGTHLRAGIVNGDKSMAELLWIRDTRVGLRLHSFHHAAPTPTIDLILALPRPKVLKRLLPQIAALGLRRLTLCNASRVERSFFDTHVLELSQLRRLLLDGLQQAGETRLPEVRLARRITACLRDDLADAPEQRLALHPGDAPHLLQSLANAPLLLAIGPEGGWIPHELALLEDAGFARATLGPRILRSETATVAALSLAHARLQESC